MIAIATGQAHESICPNPALLESTTKPSGSPGTVSASARLQRGHGLPGAPQQQAGALDVAPGRSGWASQTQRALAQRAQNFMVASDVLSFR